MVISEEPTSLQTFQLYGCRFGGIEPHFKDYKSAGFEIIRSKLRNAQALSCLLMLLAAATIIAISLSVIVIKLIGIDFALTIFWNFCGVGILPAQIMQLKYSLAYSKSSGLS